MKKFLVNSVIGICLFTCGLSCIVEKYGDVPKKEEVVKHEYSTTVNTTSDKELNDDYEGLEEEKKEEEVKEIHEEKVKKVEKTTKKANKPVKKTTKKRNSNQTIEKSAGKQVWVTGSGSKYHSHNNCGKTNSRNARLVPLSEAQIRCTPCKKCF